MLLLLLASLGTAPSARAQTWTEAVVVERAAEQAPGSLVARARTALARARAGATPRHPDPSIAVGREQTFGDGAPYEMSLALEVPIDLSSRRAVARHLARAEAATARAEGTVARNEAITLAVLAFVDALAEAARVLGRREEAGTAAGYDRVRLELEMELARSALADARARLEMAKDLLRILIAPGVAAPEELSGSLATDDPGSLDAWLARARDHAGLEQSRLATEAAGDAVDSSGAAWIPMLGLVGGARLEGGGGETRWGYVAGVAVGIPLFGGDHGLPEVARAERSAAQARTAALERDLAAEVTVAHRRLIAARAELARFREATEARLDLLSRGAESGYREGRRTIVELLDARRAATAVQRRVLALEVEARRAEAQLRGAAGAWE